MAFAAPLWEGGKWQLWESVADMSAAKRKFLEINDKPIEFEDLRTKLTQDYVKRHY
jgi:hypothetical protein